MKTTDSSTALLLGGLSEVLLSSQTFTSYPTGVQCLTSVEAPLHHAAGEVAGFSCPAFCILCRFWNYLFYLSFLSLSWR